MMLHSYGLKVALAFCYLLIGKLNLLGQLTTPYQYDEKPSLQLGASLGLGGLTLEGKPALDAHYGRLRLSLAPGLLFISGGLTAQLGKGLRNRACVYRPFYAGLSLHNSWGLWHSWHHDAAVQRQRLYLLMAGLHHPLNGRGTLYLEYGLGLGYMKELLTPDAGTARHYFLPMAELRMGGLFRLKGRFARP